MARGVVKFFKHEKGWGAISCAELPPDRDAWVHFSAIEGDGHRSLTAGDLVEFEVEQEPQDSFEFRATRVRWLASGPAPTLRRVGERVVIVPDGTADTAAP